MALARHKNVVQYLALAQVIDDKKGAKILVDAATETLSELVDEYSEKEGLMPEADDIDLDLDLEDDLEDPTLELEDLEEDTTLGEAEDEDEDEEDDSGDDDIPAEDDDEDDIVEIDDDEDEDEEEEEEEKKAESKVTRRALAIANRLHSTGDPELQKVAKILAKQLSEKKS